MTRHSETPLCKVLFSLATTLVITINGLFLFTADRSLSNRPRPLTPHLALMGPLGERYSAGKRVAGAGMSGSLTQDFTLLNDDTSL